MKTLKITDIRKIAKEHDWPDSWWYCKEETVSEEPIKIGSVPRDGTVHVKNVQDTSEDWIRFRYRGYVTPEELEKKKYVMNASADKLGHKFSKYGICTTCGYSRSHVESRGCSCSTAQNSKRYSMEGIQAFFNDAPTSIKRQVAAIENDDSKQACYFAINTDKRYGNTYYYTFDVEDLVHWRNQGKLKGDSPYWINSHKGIEEFGQLSDVIGRRQNPIADPGEYESYQPPRKAVNKKKETTEKFNAIAEFKELIADRSADDIAAAFLAGIIGLIVILLSLSVVVAVVGTLINAFDGQTKNSSSPSTYIAAPEIRTHMDYLEAS